MPTAKLPDSNDIGYIRCLMSVGKRKGALRDFIVALLARKPARLATVALGPQARPDRAMMQSGESFRAEMFAKA